MSLDVNNVMDRICNFALTLGVFETVNKHEAKNAPGNGYHAAVWIQGVSPIRGGLASTSVRAEFTFRIYGNMLQEPQDEIDPDISYAAERLMSAIHSDFDMGSTARNVDLLGSEGTPLSARSGYISLSQKLYRVMDVTIPVLINDVWEQTA